MIGEKLGDYEVIGTLGKGGFGSVYRAKDGKGDLVAIKVLNPQALDNDRVVKKFFHEAMILSKLDHPNICKLLDFFPDGTNYAIVMEFVKGEELKSMLKRYNGPLPFDLAYKLSTQATDAFQYAHENGILHRDIKPANMVITQEGIVKIMDFGIAKMSSTASHDTAASMLSVHYVPPERFDKSREIDVRSDIYSLGLVFYEIFAGRRPFTATETSQIIFSHMNQIPDPPIKHSPHLPEGVSAAISKALEKDPNDRFRDFREFAEALKSVDQDEIDDATAFIDTEATQIDMTVVTDGIISAGDDDELVAEPPKKKTGVMIAAGIAALVLAVGGVGAYFALAPKQPAGDQPAAVAAKVVEQPPTADAVRNAKGFYEVKSSKDTAAMVMVPGGTFSMGSDKYSAEKPPQQITMSRFFIDKYPVTNAQFAKFVEATGYVTSAEKDGGMVRIGRRWKKVPEANWRLPDGVSAIDGLDEHPVRQVSYTDALNYCQWAGKDLPTEAQWEMAARGPNGNVYPWGDSDPNDTTANFDGIVGTTTPVTEYEKGQSFYGVQGMAGNVYNWCRDWYAVGQRAAKDPTGPEKGTERVVKGGSFAEGMESIRSANRDRYDPNYSSFLFGFRCASKNLPK